MKRKKRKLKINTQNKSYSIHDSALYQVSSKKKLSQKLLTSVERLKDLTSDDNYNLFTDNSSDKPREIEQPSFELDQVQTRIASLICRIKQPEYLHSGIKGRSHVTNAKAHIGKHKVLTTDVKSFFPSTTKEMVFSFFHKRMKCPPDVAEILSGLCTYSGYIPTGSRISMPLAFWANEEMFNTLHKISRQRTIKMTVFVDDITFSGNQINRAFIHKVKNIMSNFEHKMHPDKTRLYEPSEVKVITGVAVSNTGIHITNKQHMNINQDMLQWLATKDVFQINKLNERLLGRISSQSIIDSRYVDKARSLRKEFK